nr:MAG TPA: hypothetical protein [Caudoviricetes sp.]
MLTHGSVSCQIHQRSRRRLKKRFLRRCRM